jgi:hypothetical protein
MRKALYAILSMLILFSCGPVMQEVERIYEEGVEVVLNHLEPYKIKNDFTDFDFHEEFSIDFGSEEIGELGIADAMDFEVDSKGCIYFTYSHKQDDMIFKFSPSGQFIKSWEKKGRVLGKCSLSFQHG